MSAPFIAKHKSGKTYLVTAVTTTSSHRACFQAVEITNNNSTVIGNPFEEILASECVFAGYDCPVPINVMNWPGPVPMRPAGKKLLVPAGAMQQ